MLGESDSSVYEKGGFTELLVKGSVEGWYYPMKCRALAKVLKDLGISDLKGEMLDVGGNIGGTIKHKLGDMVEQVAPGINYHVIDLDPHAFDVDFIRGIQDEQIRKATDEGDFQKAEQWRIYGEPHDIENVKGVRGDALELPYSNDTAQVVLFSDCIEHIPNYDLALREATRVLKEDGYLIIVIPSFYNLDVFKSQKTPKISDNLKELNGTHVNFWSQEEVSEILRKHGCDVKMKPKPLAIFSGACNLLFLNEESWVETGRQPQEARDLTNSVNHLFSGPIVEFLDDYLYTHEDVLLDIIKSASTPIDLIRGLVNLLKDFFPQVDQSKLEELIAKLDSDEKLFNLEDIMEKWKKVKGFLLDNPFSIGNSIIIAAQKNAN